MVLGGAGRVLEAVVTAVVVAGRGRAAVETGREAAARVKAVVDMYVAVTRATRQLVVLTNP